MENASRQACSSPLAHPTKRRPRSRDAPTECRSMFWSLSPLLSRPGLSSFLIDVLKENEGMVRMREDVEIWTLHSLHFLNGVEGGSKKGWGGKGIVGC